MPVPTLKRVMTVVVAVVLMISMRFHTEKPNYLEIASGGNFLRTLQE